MERSSLASRGMRAECDKGTEAPSWLQLPPERKGGQYQMRPRPGRESTLDIASPTSDNKDLS
eukprot:3487648-Pyramimonas_sp.AAC.1